MIQSNCPRCDEVFRVPDAEMPEDAYAQCPWCRETFPIAEVTLPPVLQVLSADGKTLQLSPTQEPMVSGVSEQGSRGSVQMFDHDADMEPHHDHDDMFDTGVEIVDPNLAGEGSASKTVSDETVAETWNDSATDGVDFDVEDPNDTWNEAPESDPPQGNAIAPMKVTASPSHPRKPKGSSTRTLLGIVLGGVSAVPLAIGILWVLTQFGVDVDLGFWPLDGQSAVAGSQRVAAKPLPLDEKQDSPPPERSAQFQKSLLNQNGSVRSFEEEDTDNGTFTTTDDSPGLADDRSGLANHLPGLADDRPGLADSDSERTGETVIADSAVGTPATPDPFGTPATPDPFATPTTPDPTGSESDEIIADDEGEAAPGVNALAMPDPALSDQPAIEGSQASEIDPSGRSNEPFVIPEVSEIQDSVVPNEPVEAGETVSAIPAENSFDELIKDPSPTTIPVVTNQPADEPADVTAAANEAVGKIDQLIALDRAANNPKTLLGRTYISIANVGVIAKNDSESIQKLISKIKASPDLEIWAKASAEWVGLDKQRRPTDGILLIGRPGDGAITLTGKDGDVEVRLSDDSQELPDAERVIGLGRILSDSSGLSVELIATDKLP